MRSIVVSACLIGAVTACSVVYPPTAGPAVRITSDGWIADPPSTVQTGDWFEFTVTNGLDSPLRFVVLSLNYGEPTDIPVVDGVVDVNRQVVYESADPPDPGEPVVAYALVYPGSFGEGTAWDPAVLESGETTTVRVGNPGLGGGEPGRFVVVSHEAGGFERGDFVVFDMTDEAGNVPQFTREDFFPSDEPDS